MELFIVAEAHLDAGLLEVIADHDLFLYERNDFILFEAEERILIHFQGLLEGFKLGFHSLGQTVFLQGLFHFVKHCAGAGAVIELLVTGKSYKVFIVREVEIIHGGDFLVLTDILHCILIHNAAKDQRVSEAGILVGLYLEVRGDAAAVTYGAATHGLELMGKGIRNMANGTVFIAMGVVNGGV